MTRLSLVLPIASWVLASSLRRGRRGVPAESLQEVLNAQCSVQQQDRRDCGFVGVNQGSCEAQGCCWKPVNPNPGNVPWCFHGSSSPSPPPPETCSVQHHDRRDCGFNGVNEGSCVGKGCCWESVDPNPGNVPWCFHSSGSSPSPAPSPGPAPPPAGFRADNPVSSRDAFVHLFEWSWSDIAQECEQFLGPKGYSAVQISPPNDHMAGYQWWTRYQPVTYDLNSRSGDEAAFIDMVQRCKAVGVGIYADAVINHIAAGGGSSVGGRHYGNRSTPIYSQWDMHHSDGDLSRNCRINDYTNQRNVQFCDLVGLPDLCTSCKYVQEKIAAFLNDMGAKGIAGFRIDAAKHIEAGELGGILSRVDPKLYRFSEVISGVGEPITPRHYTHLGDVTEFTYFRSLAPNFHHAGDLKNVENFGESWGMIPGHEAVVFMDNHDTQRSEPELTYKDGDLYTLANVFMLAHPYGYPKVMSSYFFNGFDEGPPSSSVHGGGSVSCFHGKPWVCEHRWGPIANMVNWRLSAGTAGVEHFQAPSGSTVAFCRGGAACVALNQGNHAWSANVFFSVPAGEYCNVIESDDTASCPRIRVDGSGWARFEVPPVGAVAVHLGRMMAAAS